MNETAITRFLATEVMSWDVIGPDKLLFLEDKESTDWEWFWSIGIGEDSAFKLHRPFDPIHNIAHAFMVEARMLFLGEGVHEKYAEELSTFFVENPDDWDGWFHTIHASPKHRMLTVVRTLATKDQIKEFEL